MGKRDLGTTWVPLINFMTSPSGAISATTLTTVLTVTLPKVGSYYFVANLGLIGNGTASEVGVNVGGTCTPSAWRFNAQLNAATSHGSNGSGTSFAATGQDISGITTEVTECGLIMTGTVTVSVVGTFTIAVSRISGTGTFTVRSGSILRVDQYS